VGVPSFSQLQLNKHNPQFLEEWWQKLEVPDYLPPQLKQQVLGKVQKLIG
jgi:hypothetical protein